ncbi:MAG: helix-turn-helix domain-containing protein [Polyangiaceae bacterium]
MSAKPKRPDLAPPTGSRAAQKLATRTELLAAARRCFEKHGYANTAVGDIAREAGVAHGTFYVHFASREAAADALLEAFNDALARRLGPLLASEAASSAVAPTELVAAAARLFLDALDEDRTLVRFYAERATFGLTAETLASGVNPPALEALTTALVSRGAPKERPLLELAAHGLLALWLRVGLRYALVAGATRADAESALTRLTTGALAQLLTSPPKKRTT